MNDNPRLSHSSGRPSAAALGPTEGENEERKSLTLGGSVTSLADQNAETKSDFTEVFSWGSDRFGQLGLGQQNQM